MLEILRLPFEALKQFFCSLQMEGIQFQALEKIILFKMRLNRFVLQKRLKAFFAISALKTPKVHLMLHQGQI